MVSLFRRDGMSALWSSSHSGHLCSSQLSTYCERASQASKRRVRAVEIMPALPSYRASCLGLELEYVDQPHIPDFFASL